MKACSGSPLFCMPRKYIIRGTQTRASIVIHASRIRRCGRASTASGTSHSEYWGLHTLLVSRNAATTRKHNWARRGRRGAVHASHAMPPQAAANSSSDTEFSVEVSQPDHPVSDRATL